LRIRLWLGFGCLLLILLLVSGLTIVVFTRYSVALENVFRDNYRSAVYCDAMKESLDQLNIRAQQLIWAEPVARKIDYKAIESQFQSNLDLQLKNITVPGELEATRHLVELWRQYQQHYLAFDDSPANRPARYQQDLLPLYDQIVPVAQQVSDMNMTSMVSVDGQAKQTLLEVRNLLFILVIVGSVLAGVVVWTAGVTVLRPLKDFTESARQIEAGNLELNLQPRSRDEIGKLAAAFNSMASRLREFKRADHDRLIRSRQTTQLAIDSLPEAVFVIGPDEKIEISNDAARNYFRIEPGLAIECLGLKWLAPLYQEVKINKRATEPRGYESAVQIFVDGQERFLLPKAVPMLSADHRQVGVTLILVDVTQLRQVDEAKSGLVSTVSHELRTPLTSQQLLLGLLMTTLGPTLPAKQKRMLEVVKADSDRLYRTIDDLLSISRMESGREQFQFRPIAPIAIVVTSVEPLRQLFSEKGLDLQVNIPADLPLVRADGISINSALTNLLSNALKFTPAGGTVTVAAAQVEEGTVAFSVCDTGPGIPEEFRPRIFEKFFRVPAAAGPTGSGLGLSIARKIVESHGGRIEFSCPPTGGTKFCFYLPLAR
jgi:two-component system, NtrC family, sensor histidine kinase KinB